MSFLPVTFVPPSVWSHKSMLNHKADLILSIEEIVCPERVPVSGTIYVRVEEVRKGVNFPPTHQPSCCRH